MNDRIAIHVDADLEELIPGFLDNRHKDAARLAALLEAGDFAEIRRIGHSMKGAGGGYGFDAITDIGAAIEEAALCRDAAAIAASAVELSDYLSRVDVIIEP
ncbi:MAG: Hpt domain-containing protein [Gammaproteobacteria bacterium]